PFTSFSSHPPATPIIYTLSLHDALPISSAPSNYPSGQMCYMPYLKGAFFTGNRFSGNIVSYSQGAVPVVLFSVWSADPGSRPGQDRKSTRLNSSHGSISYAVFCLKKQKL